MCRLALIVLCAALTAEFGSLHASTLNGSIQKKSIKTKKSKNVQEPELPKWKVALRKRVSEFTHYAWVGDNNNTIKYVDPDSIKRLGLKRTKEKLNNLTKILVYADVLEKNIRVSKITKIGKTTIVSYSVYRLDKWSRPLPTFWVEREGKWYIKL